MYRKYFQFSTQYLKSYMPSSNSTFLGVNCENYLPKRWAGHSKWQNIKSTKQAQDLKKSTAFQNLSRLITLAVKQSGPDLTTNSKLKALFEESRKVNMPKANFEKIVKSAQAEADKPYWTVFSGPKGIVVGFEVTFANNKPSFLITKLATQTKKLKLKMEPHFGHLCTERGIIIASPLENVENAYEKAVEDAIEIGIDEVHESEDKSLIFECTADRIDSYLKQLMKKGYNIESSSTELDFKDFVQLEDEEVNNIEKIISNLQNQYEEVIRASYNKAEQ